MKYMTILTWAVVITGVALWLPMGALAQDSKQPAVEQGAPSSAEDSVVRMQAAVKSALAAVEADSAIESSVKNLLLPMYEQASEALQEATNCVTKAAEFRASMTEAPGTATKLRAQLQELPSVESAGSVGTPANPEELQQAIDSQRAALAGLNEQLSKVTADLGLSERRPAEISVRIPEAERKLTDARKQLASPDLAGKVTSPGRVADRFLLQARELKLQMELEMLRQEQLSLPARRNLQQAQRELFTRQIENVSAAVTTYLKLMNKSVTKTAQDIGARAKQLGLKIAEDDQEALALAAEVQNLAKQLKTVLQDTQDVFAAKTEVNNRLQRLTKRYESISRQLELDRPGGEMAQVFIELRALLGKRVRETAQMRRWPTLGQTRLDALQVDYEIEALSDAQEPSTDSPSSHVQELVVARGEVLDTLQKHYVELVPRIAALETEIGLYLEKVTEVRANLTQQLFWIQNSPPLSSHTFSEIPNGLRWAFSREHLSESGLVLKQAIIQSPGTTAAVAFFVIALFVMRPQIGGALQRTGNNVGRVSSDRIGLTAQAVLWTGLLALPVPMLVGYMAWAFGKVDAPSDWLRDITEGMNQLLLAISTASAIAACCYPGGLGETHFGWRKKSLSWLRGGSYWFAFVYSPLALLAYCTLSSESGRFLHNLGRVSMLIALAWLLAILVRLFFFSKVMHSTRVSENLAQPAIRSGIPWSMLVIGVVPSLMVLISLGYTIATFNLSFSLVLTLITIVSGAILYELALRWFRIEQRRLAFAEALQRRRARQEAAASEDQLEESAEIISVDEDEQELDLDSVGEQTRSVLKLLFGIGIAIVVLSLWSTTLPLIPFLDTIKIPMTVNFTLLGLVKAMLIVCVSWLVTKNLPGILELSILRATSLDSGTRHAVTTICQYAIVATAIILLFNAFNLDWAKFGWIAGGLSVGIGFGMQEIVANFISGLILLFERPIRVGDVVTVEGTTGTVTRLHLRATTVTNWDRQEFVVPNKTLITGTILNWTLSERLTRILIPVGVAYGSDTEQARQILVDTAADHPRILEDPPPLASFEQFADSSLNLVLRAFLPDLDSRLATITELHTEINKRFASAGIEIAFPQRDVHVRASSDNESFAAREQLNDGQLASFRQADPSASK